MKRLVLLMVIVVAIVEGCSIPSVCNGMAPKEYELKWDEYNGVDEFRRYFSGYETTIMQHIGDTIKLYGYLSPAVCHNSEDQEYFDGGQGFDLFSSADGGSAVYVFSGGNLSIPLSFIYKKIYMIGIFTYDENMGCRHGSYLRLVSLDTVLNK